MPDFDEKSKIGV